MATVDLTIRGTSILEVNFENGQKKTYTLRTDDDNYWQVQESYFSIKSQNRHLASTACTLQYLVTHWNRL